MSDGSTGSIRVRVFDGTRQPFGQKQILVRMMDGNKKMLEEQFFDVPEITFKDIVLQENLGDAYTLIASHDGYKDAGFFPVKLAANVITTVDIMLIPSNAKFDFSQASWNALPQSDPQIFALISAGTDVASARQRFESLMANRPASLASFFNLTAAMRQIHLPTGTPLDYLKEIKWDETFAQDRFFVYADPELLNQTVLAWQQGEFAPEEGSSFFHPGATTSYKQVQFGEANVQLTFHEQDIKEIGSLKCILVEPDIDYYKDLLAHALLEVAVNHLTESLTNPKQVYVLRWIAGRRAGNREFSPPYTILPA